MIGVPEWCRECPFYYQGMTAEDYLYIQYLIKNGKQNIALQIQRGEIELPEIDNRKKGDVFAVFGGNPDYKFDIETMC